VKQGLFYEVPGSHSDMSHCVGLLSPSQRPLPDKTQSSQETDIHAPGGIRTRNPSKRTNLNPRLRSRSHWERLSLRSTSTQFIFVGLQQTGNSPTKPGTLDESEHRIRDKYASVPFDSVRKNVEPVSSRLQKCM